MSDVVRIWSFEHNAWWAPKEMGYTAYINSAGVYDRKRAEQIVRNANIACDAEHPNEELREIDNGRDAP